MPERPSDQTEQTADVGARPGRRRQEGRYPRGIAFCSGAWKALVERQNVMKIVVIGGTGLIGSKLVKQLGERGHTAIAASPSCSAAPLTAEAMTGQPKAKASNGGRLSGPNSVGKNSAIALR